MAHKFPENWKAYKLDQLGLVARGRSRHRPRNEPSLYGGEYPFFQTGDIKAANLYLADYTQTYNEKGLAQSKLWGPETLCITIAANIADTAILGIRGCFPDSVIGFIPDKKAADVHFVKYYIDMIKLDMQQVSHGTTQDNLSLDKLLRFDFIIPLVDEQRKIAAILSAYDNLIENNLRRIKILEEMAQNLYREWFVNFRFPGHEKARLVDSPLGLIPEGWEVENLKDICNITMGQSPKSDFYNETGDGLPFHQGVSNFGDRFPKTKYFCTMANRLANKGDILFSVRAPVGRINIANEKMIIGRGLSAITHKLGFQWFLYHMLKEIFIDEDTIGGGTIFKSVTKNDMETIKLVTPVSELKERFELLVKPSERLIENIEKRITILRQTRDLLLPKLISGEVDVSELDISVPEEAVS
jgi:type I restriction enzyme, S subunit